MTKEDIQIVEENAHLKRFVFDLVRCIDEGVPVASYFACTDKNNGSVDTTLFNAQKYVADALVDRQFFGGNSVCKFKIGDTIVSKNMPDQKLSVVDFVDVYIGDNRKAKGVLISGYERYRVFNVEFVNQRFELA
jgi:hypothetical protein